MRFRSLPLLFVLLPNIARSGEGADAALGLALFVLGMTAALMIVGVLAAGRGNRVLYLFTSPVLVAAYLIIVYQLSERHYLSATAGHDIYAFQLTPGGDHLRYFATRI